MATSDIRKAWAEDRWRQFCKQSCTKISLGLDNLDQRSGERAIWELFQNARDLAMSTESGHKEAYIRITLTSSEFVFAHKGRPFTHNSFNSLVMQTSSQEKEDENSVGQYGTGFLTTHKFGRLIKVFGSLDMENQAPGMFVDINGFTIDRNFNDITEFVSKMASQLQEIEDYADAPKTTNYRKWTELHYQLSSAEGAGLTASTALQKASQIMPYVMTINAPIVNVELIDETVGNKVTFTKTILSDEDGLRVMGININRNGLSEQTKIYYLRSEDGKDIAILPLESPTKAKSLKGIAKLFVFFPLLGTEDFGMDFVFHSHRFFPVEARDAIHLPVENANVRSKYEANVAVLNEMTQMVFNWLRPRAEQIEGWVNISALPFECVRNKEDKTNEFFKIFKQTWVNFYKSLSIIDTEVGKASLSSGKVKVFANEIASALKGEQAHYFDAVYHSVDCKGLPSKTSALVWNDVISTWEPSEASCFLTADNIASVVAESKYDTSTLHKFDAFLKAIGRGDLFDKYALIPNREGVLKVKSQLRDAKHIPQWLYETVKPLVVNSIESLVDMSFADIDVLAEFSRKDLRDSIRNALIELRKKHLDNVIPECYPTGIIKALFNISCISQSETGNIKRNEALMVMGKHLNITPQPQVLVALDSDEADMAKLPFWHLAENCLLEISKMEKTEVPEQIDYILQLHSSLSCWAEYYNRNNGEGIATKYGAFPNRMNQPCMAKDLMHGTDIPEELVDLYDKIFNDKLMQGLVNEDFAGFVKFESTSAAAVAKKIQDKLSDENFESEYVLDIINKLDDSQWASWFKEINEKKADLFMKQVKPECKDQVFKLMKVEDPEKLKLLAELAEEENIEEILRRGREARLAEQNKQTDFEFKHSLGKYAEDFIHAELDKQLSGASKDIKVEVEEQQGGQDMIVYADNKPVYYLEIKSRWGSDQSVMMSPRQMQRSVEKSDQYSLCCVDMTRFSISDCEAHVYPEFEQVIPNIYCLNHIGKLNERLTIGLTDNGIEGVHIGGDYKCIVPQEVIKIHGTSFKKMLEIIARACVSDK